MANLGAICWSSFKDGLYSQWANTMTSEEAEKATLYKEEGRREGREAVLDSVKSRLAAVDTLQAELAMVRATNEMLRKSTEEAAVTRAEALWATKKGEFEIEKLKEISVLKTQISEAALAKQMIAMLQDKNESLKDDKARSIAELNAKIATLEAARLELMQQKTKSSQSIGKIGEATVLELLNDIKKSTFHYSTVKDMTGAAHAADFHVWIMRPSGKRIKMLVDAKKYAKAVNTGELTKLNNDIDADEEARCGMLISLETPICATEQFEIKNTKKNKPVLCLTLQDMDYERRKEVITWAIQTLMTLVGEEDPAEKTRMLDQIDDFLHEINASLKDIDGVIKMQQKAMDGLRTVRTDLTDKLKGFSGKQDLDTIEHVGDGSDPLADCVYEPCVTIVKATGEPCGKPSIEGSKKCNSHTSSKMKKLAKASGRKA